MPHLFDDIQHELMQQLEAVESVAPSPPTTTEAAASEGDDEEDVAVTSAPDDSAAGSPFQRLSLFHVSRDGILRKKSTAHRIMLRKELGVKHAHRPRSNLCLIKMWRRLASNKLQHR